MKKIRISRIYIVKILVMTYFFKDLSLPKEIVYIYIYIYIIRSRDFFHCLYKYFLKMKYTIILNNIKFIFPMKMHVFEFQTRIGFYIYILLNEYIKIEKIFQYIIIQNNSN